MKGVLFLFLSFAAIFLTVSNLEGVFAENMLSKKNKQKNNPKTKINRIILT